VQTTGSRTLLVRPAALKLLVGAMLLLGLMAVLTVFVSETSAGGVRERGACGHHRFPPAGVLEGEPGGDRY
jgi:hypothetical protein